LKIVDITAYPVSIPLIQFEDGGISPYQTSCGVVEDAQSVIIKVETDGGYVGWGEMKMVFSPATIKAIIEDELGSELIGRDPLKIRKMLDELSFNISMQYFSAPSLISGIETACWDILGRVLNKPISSLLGGSMRTRLPISYCLGILSPEKSASRAQEIVKKGFSTIKTKAGLDLIYDLERIKALRKGGGRELKIRVDMNQALSPPEALEFIKKTEEFDLEYVEQPIKANSFGDLAVLRNRTQTPIAVNEDCYLEGNIVQIVKDDAVDTAVVDLEPLGGLIKLIEFEGLAGMSNIPLAHHCGFDMGIKTAAILQGTSCLKGFNLAMDSTYYAHQDDILSERLTVKNGAFELPQEPGLGIRVDENKLEKYLIS